MIIRILYHIRGPKLIGQVFQNCDLKAFNLVIIVLMLTLGCRHTLETSSQANTKEINPDWKPLNNPEEFIECLSVNDVLQNPELHINKKISIVGTVNNLQLKKSSKGYRVLAVDLRDKGNTIHVEGEKEFGVRLNILEQVDSISELLVQSAQDIDLSSLEVAIFQDLSYDLKINGNRIRALSNFLRSKDKLDIGDDFELIGNGYLKLGDAFYSFSNLILENKPEFSLEQVEVTSDITIPNAKTNSFQDTIKSVALELSNLANLLIENRSKLVSGELAFDREMNYTNKGFSLLSIGDMFEAKHWESKKNQEEISGEQFDILSKGFTLVGNGINDVYTGCKDLGEKLTIRVEPIKVNVVECPTVKCAYVGYNKFVLRDCERKVNQLGRDDVITVRGRLVRGNLHEQLNLLWLKMDSVTIDDLTINLAHNESNSTWRNLSNIYDWVKETTN